MQRSKVILLATLIALVLPPVVISRAESPTPKTTQATEKRVKKKRNKSDLDILFLELHMGESGYKINQSMENEARLLGVYEKLINRICMESLLSDTLYSGKPTDEECLDYIDKATKIDPGNPAAACAQLGIDSKPCVLAYSNQKVSLLESEGQMSNLANVTNTPSSTQQQLLADDQLKAKLAESSNDQKLAPLLVKVRELDSEYRDTKDPADLLKLKEGVRALLVGSCSNSVVRYLVVSKAISRIRFISRNCMEAINQAMRIDPNFASAICARDGFYTPSCTKARRLAASAAKSSRNTKGSGDPKAASSPTQDKGFISF